MRVEVVVFETGKPAEHSVQDNMSQRQVNWLISLMSRSLNGEHNPDPDCRVRFVVTEDNPPKGLCPLCIHKGSTCNLCWTAEYDDADIINRSSNVEEEAGPDDVLRRG